MTPKTIFKYTMFLKNKLIGIFNHNNNDDLSSVKDKNSDIVI